MSIFVCIYIRILSLIFVIFHVLTILPLPIVAFWYLWLTGVGDTILEVFGCELSEFVVFGPKTIAPTPKPFKMRNSWNTQPTTLEAIPLTPADHKYHKATMEKNKMIKMHKPKINHGDYYIIYHLNIYSSLNG